MCVRLLTLVFYEFLGDCDDTGRVTFNLRSTVTQSITSCYNPGTAMFESALYMY